MVQPEQYFIADNGTFPNSKLPVLLYKKALHLPLLFAANHIKRVFKKNGWTNNWTNGIYIYNHYHSVTHEALGASQGKIILQLGGDDGVEVTFEKGDVIIIPAGVAHKNLNGENEITCVGGYPQGHDFDMNYGKPSERPKTDENIAAIPVPECDPIFGRKEGVAMIWKLIK